MIAHEISKPPTEPLYHVMVKNYSASKRNKLIAASTTCERAQKEARSRPVLVLRGGGRLPRQPNLIVHVF